MRPTNARVVLHSQMGAHLGAHWVPVLVEMASERLLRITFHAGLDHQDIQQSKIIYDAQAIFGEYFAMCDRYMGFVVPRVEPPAI